MQLTRDILLALIFIAIILTQTPQGAQILATPGQTHPLQGTLSNIDQSVNSIDSDTDQLSNLLKQNRFNAEDFAQEPTLQQLLDTAATEETLNEINERNERSVGLFGGIDVNNRQTLFHIESTVPLNDRRNDWTGNITWTGSTYRMKGISEIRSNQRGEYQPGSTAQAGEMVRIVDMPDAGDTVEWLYFNGEDGMYFGVNNTCTYVELKKDNQTLRSVCQDNWNVNTVNTTQETSYNPSGEKLDLNDVNMYQTEFAWYGAGIIEMDIIFDDPSYGQKTVTVHRFDIENQTSLGQVSLPIKTQITGDTDNSTVVDVGGRQFSIQDNYEPTERQTKVFVETITASGTEYTPAVSIRAREGFENVNLDLISFSGTPNCDVNALVRYDTSLTGANWTEPRLASYNETLIEVDKDATSWQVNGEFSGQYLDFAQLAGGQNVNKPISSVQSEEVSSVIGDNETVSLGFKADGTSCDVNDITLQVKEDF